MNKEAYLSGYLNKEAIAPLVAAPLLYSAGGTLLRVLSALSAIPTAIGTVKETGSGIASLGRGEGKAGAAHFGKALLNALGTAMGIAFGAPGVARIGTGIKYMGRHNIGSSMTRAGKGLTALPHASWNAAPAGSGWMMRNIFNPLWQTGRQVGYALDYPFRKAVGYGLRGTAPAVTAMGKVSPTATGYLHRAQRGLGGAIETGATDVAKPFNWSMHPLIATPYIAAGLTGLQGKAEGTLEGVIQKSKAQKTIQGLLRQGYSPDDIMRMFK